MQGILEQLDITSGWVLEPEVSLRIPNCGISVSTSISWNWSVKWSSDDAMLNTIYKSWVIIYESLIMIHKVQLKVKLTWSAWLQHPFQHRKKSECHQLACPWNVQSHSCILKSEFDGRPGTSQNELKECPANFPWWYSPNDCLVLPIIFPAGVKNPRFLSSVGTEKTEKNTVCLILVNKRWS